MSEDYNTAHQLEGHIPFTRVCAKNFHNTGTWNFSEQYIHELAIVNFDSYYMSYIIVCNLLNL